MFHNKKGFTLIEITIVLALIGLFFVMTSYMTKDARIYQTNAERLANAVYDTIRTARNNMIIGRGVLSGATMVVTTKRSITITSTGIVTTYYYNTSSSGTESKLLFPFFDGDPQYKIANMTVSSGTISAGILPPWDQTNITSITIDILPNADMTISAIKSGTPISTPIRAFMITAGYGTFTRSVISDSVRGTLEVMTGGGGGVSSTPVTLPVIPFVNGSCSTTAGACIAGTVSAFVTPACGTSITWNCDGAGTGTSANCSGPNACAPVSCLIGTHNIGSCIISS